VIAAVVADDFTGANDCAGSFAASGLLVFSARGAHFPRQEPEVYARSVETRFLEPRLARKKTREAWQSLQGRGRRVDYQKMDSTFRGNPADEILGMLEAGGPKKIAFCAAYPLHGRSILKGVARVHGIRLDKSEYAKDPLTPSRTANPISLFPRGLARAIGRGSLSALRRGIRLGSGRILCFDALERRDLSLIAKACLLEGIRHFAGSSGLSTALAPQLKPASPLAVPRLGSRSRAALLGSVSEMTLEQLRRLEASGLAPWLCLGEDLPPRIRGDFALSSLRERAQMRRFRDAAAQKRFADQRMARLVRQGLRLAGGPLGRLWLLAGGHCAETFYRALNLKGSWVRGNLFPGLPLLEAEGAQGPVFCATKPGGFGGPETIVQFMKLGREK
jgi:uncharacterized protein YgbK (DUF1537 family)